MWHGKYVIEECKKYILNFRLPIQSNRLEGSTRALHLTLTYHRHRYLSDHQTTVLESKKSVTVL